MGHFSPVIQNDAEDGFIYGVKARLKIIATFYIEPYVLHVQENDREIKTGNTSTTIDGTTISSLGTNFIIGTWLNEIVRPYAMIGIGFFKVNSQTSNGELNRIGYNWGVGLEYTLIPKHLFMDMNAQLQMIDLDNQTYRKGICLSAGFNWYFRIN